MSLIVLLPIDWYLNPKPIIVLVVIVFIRIYMLWTAKKYITALEERVGESEE